MQLKIRQILANKINELIRGARLVRESLTAILVANVYFGRSMAQIRFDPNDSQPGIGLAK